MSFMQEMPDTRFFNEGVKGWFSGSREEAPAGPTLALFLSSNPISPGQVSPAFSENLQQPYGQQPGGFKMCPPHPLFWHSLRAGFHFREG